MEQIGTTRKFGVTYSTDVKGDNQLMSHSERGTNRYLVKRKDKSEGFDNMQKSWTRRYNYIASLLSRCFKAEKLLSVQVSKGLFLAISLFLTINFLNMVFADDDHQRKRHRYRGGSQKIEDKDNLNRDSHFKPVTNQTYRKTCGECHFVYQPGLLPSASWLNILNRLDDHFGEEIEVDSNRLKIISNYLSSYAAETSSAKWAVKIMRCLGKQVPGAITDIPYIRKKHRKISANVLKRKSIGSLSNCSACHTTAEKGIYEDDDVKIPE
jgi:hypothetical protein